MPKSRADYMRDYRTKKKPGSDEETPDWPLVVQMLGQDRRDRILDRLTKSGKEK